MNRLLLSLLFVISFTVISTACTFIPIPFCEQFDNGNTILYGKTIDVVDDGVRFQVYDLLTGNESNVIVTIYDQAPFDCNGTFYLEAATLLPMNLEVIISIEQIDSLLNPWETIGDYRVSEYYTESRRLLVEDGNVIGNITDSFAGDQSISLESFIADAQDGNINCLILSTDIDYIEDVIAFPNPASDRVFLSHIDQSPFHMNQVIAYDQMGSKLELASFTDNSLDVSQLPVGLYVLEVMYSDGLRSRHKIVITR